MNISQTLIKEKDDDLPSVINQTTPKLISINTKLYFLLVLSILMNIAQGYWINKANIRAEMNTELMFVKMYPNGTWDVEYRESGNESDFFPLTIDKLIQDYVIARYNVIPGIMRREYGFASTFMSPQLKEWFTGSGQGQYNAPDKAEELNLVRISEEINIRFVDHFDVSTGVFVQGNSDIYRSNIFIERIKKNTLGQQQGEAINEVVTLHWRIKSVNELKGFNRDALRANPIGLEIIKDTKVLDVSKTK